MTICEKILAAKSGQPEVAPEQIVEAKADFAFTNDVMIPIVLKSFMEIGAETVFDKEKIGLIPDHFVPNKDIATAQNAMMLRQFAKDYDITHYYELGRSGIEHTLIAEKGLVRPGELVIGSDSHTCMGGALGAFATGVGSTDLAALMALGAIWLKVPKSMKIEFSGARAPWVCGKDLILYTIGQLGVDGARYRAVEFSGEVISGLDMAGRFTLCNMVIEAGAKAGIIAVDDVTRRFLDGRTNENFTVYESDPDAVYEATYQWDVSGLTPVVAAPHLPSNVKPVAELADVSIDQVVIGGCTNGWTEDLRAAASIFKGKTIAPHVRCIVFPATPDIYREAASEGLIDTFVAAGAFVSGPGCGPCFGGHMGILAEGERAVSTTNRNFIGRMGHPRSEVYLSNPFVAAASAVMGRIAHPGEVAD